MNYIKAFLLCVSITIFAALGDSPKLYWLIICDINVAVWLFFAYLFDEKRRRAA